MSAQLTKVVSTLERHKRIFDLVEGNLGRELCKAATDGAQRCIAEERSPDGSPWPPLKDSYEEWKSFHYPGNSMGVLHGVMANPREVAGVVDVSPELATVAYGVSEQARREAALFQVRRKFFGLTEESRRQSKEILDRRFREGLR